MGGELEEPESELEPEPQLDIINESYVSSELIEQLTAIRKYPEYTLSFSSMEIIPEASGMFTDKVWKIVLDLKHEVTGETRKEIFVYKEFRDDPSASGQSPYQRNDTEFAYVDPLTYVNLFNGLRKALEITESISYEKPEDNGKVKLMEEDDDDEPKRTTFQFEFPDCFPASQGIFMSYVEYEGVDILRLNTINDYASPGAFIHLDQQLQALIQDLNGVPKGLLVAVDMLNDEGVIPGNFIFRTDKKQPNIIYVKLVDPLKFTRPAVSYPDSANES